MELDEGRKMVRAWAALGALLGGGHSATSKMTLLGSSHCGPMVKNQTSIHEDAGSIPGLAQWVKDLALPPGCSVGHTCSSDPALPWLWCRPGASPPIRPLACELPCAAGAALKKKKKDKMALLCVLYMPLNHRG